jgi:hypothetical protein
MSLLKVFRSDVKYMFYYYLNYIIYVAEGPNT